MENETIFAIDIGGTLSKLAYINSSPVESNLDFESSKGTVHLRLFNNNDIKDLISYMKLLKFNQPVLNITGGGAYKYSSMFESMLNTRVQKKDEIESLFIGFKAVVKEVPTPAFKFTLNNGKVLVDPLPTYSILCNIGSGVSICKIGEKIERLTGTCLGGGTVLGLATILLEVNSFDELLELCCKGDAENVDLLYSDIDPHHGEHTLAVSLGKLALSSKKNFRREDVAKSLINMIAYNIGHVAYLVGKLHQIPQVCFAGNFIRGYEYTMDRISFAVNYWSKGQSEALFLKHDGYFGALGCLFENT
jgi:pantothenate kinase